MVAMSVRLCMYSCFALSGLKGDDLLRWNEKEQQSDVRLCYFCRNSQEVDLITHPRGSRSIASRFSRALCDFVSRL